jgi:hypothetical protein
VGKKSKRSKKKRRGGSGKRGGGGQTMSGFRGGFKGLVGQGPKKKESTLSRVITYLLLAAAIAFLVYRFTR